MTTITPTSAFDPRALLRHFRGPAAARARRGDLAALDDRMLRDIAVTRAEIFRATGRLARR